MKNEIAILQSVIILQEGEEIIIEREKAEKLIEKRQSDLSNFPIKIPGKAEQFTNWEIKWIKDYIPRASEREGNGYEEWTKEDRAERESNLPKFRKAWREALGVKEMPVIDVEHESTD